MKKRVTLSQAIAGLEKESKTDRIAYGDVKQMIRAVPYKPLDNHPQSFVFDTEVQSHAEHCMGVMGYGSRDYYFEWAYVSKTK